MSDEKVRSRLDFMAIDARQQSVLAAIKPIMSSLIGGGLDRFYKKARATPEVGKFFRDDAHMLHAKSAQQTHWQRIAGGKFDEDFYASVRRIGLVHARIGLEPRWYIGAYALVLEDVLHGIAKKCSPWRRLLGLFQMPSAGDASIAVVKAALLDLELSVSIYFEQSESERNVAVSSLGAALKSLADGDLARDLSGLPTNFAALENSYNTALKSLRSLLGSVTESASAINTGSQEIAQASEDLARRTEGNAASLEQTSAALVQIDTRLKATALSSTQTVSRADQAITTVGGGRAIADEAMQAMGRVSDSAKGIDSVIEGLDKIAFQTRVLAMNAAVEAGRAGDAGRGFRGGRRPRFGARHACRGRGQARTRPADAYADRYQHGSSRGSERSTAPFRTSRATSTRFTNCLRRWPTTPPPSHPRSPRSARQSAPWTSPHSRTRRWSRKPRQPHAA